MKPLLWVDGLRVSTTERPSVELLDTVGFQIGSGRAVGVVGESGCGKSMTARAIIGLLPRGTKLTDGRIYFQRHELTHLDDQAWCRVRGAQIGFVFQEPRSTLNPVRSIGSQLREAVRIHHWGPRSAVYQRVIELLATCSLPDAERRLGDYPHEFSGGELQRICIALALAGDPKLLIADEPTTALDAGVQDEILDLLADLRRDLGLALLLITHDLRVVARLCDSILVMYAGRIVESGPTPELLNEPAHPYTQGLLSAAPRLGRSVERGTLPSIPGDVPLPNELPEGCAFHPRCYAAMPRCRKSPPPEYEVASRHRTRCYLHAPEAPGGEPRSGSEEQH